MSDSELSEVRIKSKTSSQTLDLINPPPEAKTTQAEGTRHPKVGSGAEAALKGLSPAPEATGPNKNTRAGLSRTERAAAQQQGAVDATRSRIRSAPQASKAMETLCASTEFQPTDAFSAASWAVAFKEISSSRGNSDDSSLIKDGNTGLVDKPHNQEMQESVGGMRHAGERTDSQRARESAMTTQQEHTRRAALALDQDFASPTPSVGDRHRAPPQADAASAMPSRVNPGAKRGGVEAISSERGDVQAKARGKGQGQATVDRPRSPRQIWIQDRGQSGEGREGASGSGAAGTSASRRKVKADWV